MTSPRCWKVELAAVIMVVATLVVSTPAHADLVEIIPADLAAGRPNLLLNLQAPDPANEPPKMDAPSAIPPAAPAPAPDSDAASYKTPRFWLFVGLAVVGAVAVVWGGSQLIHEINGGDPKGCAMTSIACAGEGR